jgi:polar amino acid transport system substrate-binding protein
MAVVRSLIAAIAVALGGSLSPIAAAETATCGTDYVLKEGDTLAKIAGLVYGKPSNWTVIYYANQDRLGANATLLVPGLAIRIPCVAGTQPALPSIATQPATGTATAGAAKTGGTEFSPLIKKIEFLTADDFAPYTTRTLPNGGLFTELVSAAMNELKKDSGDAFSFRVSWVNDWSAHLNPLLVTRAFDMGFPWGKPNCDDFVNLDDNSKMRCQKFFFSDPLVEEPTLFFVRKDSSLTFNSDDEMVGKTLCRPTGYFVFDLDASGRYWLRDNKVTLLNPQTIDECMKMLMDGRVDAVPISELPGRSSLINLGLTGEVKTLERPTNIGTMHVLVAKTHPNARALIHYINSAMKKLRDSGAYDQIVDRQMQAYFDMLEEQQRKPAKAPEPAPETAAKAGTEEKAN